ncbi:DUF2514 domain-containing protein [Pseudomonas sp. PB101]|uniref:DUF2514 family protein n=1 Tax=Pseudomonas sp. PB101 TaxID=2495428 RepID=UPI0013666027|nr:DUF2514 family protein [Pseudomonas sp. PB101]MVW87871.1 DUF2514 domain-containing protein [Pseudomonas sp. PB101]
MLTSVQKLFGLLAMVVLLIVAGAASAWKVQEWRYGKQLADLVAVQAQGVAQAERLAREEEQRRQSAVDRVKIDAKEQYKTATAHAADADADAASERLHVAAGKFIAGASGSTCDSNTAKRGATAARAAMVLSDLFQRTDKRAGELAAAYDRARLAGLACERSYDALRLRFK